MCVSYDDVKFTLSKLLILLFACDTTVRLVAQDINSDVLNGLV